MSLPDRQIAFRPASFDGRAVLRFLGMALFWAALILALTARDKLGNRHFQIFMGLWLAGCAAIGLCFHLWRQRRIGRYPIRFTEEGVELPAPATRRLLLVPYERIRSVWTGGRGKRARLIIDSDARTFVYPLHSFAEEGAQQRFLDALRPRLDPRHWQEMIGRHELVFPWTRRKPRATWAAALVLLAVYLLQTVLGRADDPFSLLDFGANAGFLVRHGEWYRLVAANLLHGGLAHIGSNLLFLLIYGALVEKQLGWRRTLIVMLGTGLVAQAVSAAWMELTPFSAGAVESVGFSGALFGLLGALGTLNVRFGRQVPGGFRLTPFGWISLLGLNLVVTPLLAPQIDIAAHLGGLLAGLAIGWLLLRGQATVGDMPRPGAGQRIALTGLCLLWVAGVAQTAVTALDPDRRAAEHATAVHAVRESERSRPGLDNEFAWAVATAPNPSAAELDDALFLARRAIEHEPNADDRRLERDTLATVQYRLRHFDMAIRIEQPLTYRPPVSGSRSQMARFLDARLRRNGILWIGEPGEVPQVALKVGRLDVGIPEAMPKGGEIYALVRQDGALKGMIRVFVAPTAGPLQLRDLEIAGGEQIDGAPEIVLAEIDRGGTHLDTAPVSSFFYPFEETVAELP